MTGRAACHRGPFTIPTFGTGFPRRAAFPRGAASARDTGFPRDSGMSLIEVLIAMFVLSVGAASLLALFAAAAGTHRRAAERTNACLVAEKVLSEARAAYLPERGPEEILEELRASLPEEIDGYRHETTVVRPKGDEWAPAELVVRVTVRWRSSQGDRSESFHAVIIPVHRPSASASAIPSEGARRPARR